MSYNIANANSDLSAVLHGTNLNKVTNLNQLHNRTARQLLLDIDPQETIRKVLTTTPIFNGVWDYSCPADLKGNRIIDIAPQFYRNPNQILTQAYDQDFDINKNLVNSNPDFSILFNTGLKSLRINDTSAPVGATLDTMNTTNGWNASGNALNLQTDNVNFASGSGSLEFDLTSGTNPSSGTVYKTLPTPLNLSNQYNQASVFLYVYFPTPSQILSVNMVWGSDSSDYYSRTVTMTNEGTVFQTGWNLIRGDWLGATVVGSPDASNINYISITVNYDGSQQTGIRLDNYVSIMGLYRTLLYYSKYMFRDNVTGAFQENVTDPSNIINLDTESYNLYFNLLAFYATQQVQGLDAMFFDSNFFGQEYEKGVKRYTALNKSQVQKPYTQYYTPQRGGYGQYLGRRLNF